jgi:hypothetical protein
VLEETGEGEEGNKKFLKPNGGRCFFRNRHQSGGAYQLEPVTEG